jgi:hypothetical protein
VGLHLTKCACPCWLAGIPDKELRAALHIPEANAAVLSGTEKPFRVPCRGGPGMMTPRMASNTINPVKITRLLTVLGPLNLSRARLLSTTVQQSLH